MDYKLNSLVNKFIINQILVDFVAIYIYIYIYIYDFNNKGSLVILL